MGRGRECRDGYSEIRVIYTCGKQQDQKKWAGSDYKDARASYNGCSWTQVGCSWMQVGGSWLLDSVTYDGQSIEEDLGVGLSDDLLLAVPPRPLQKQTLQQEQEEAH